MFTGMQILVSFNRAELCVDFNEIQGVPKMFLFVRLRSWQFVFSVQVEKEHGIFESNYDQEAS